jgi:ABC-type multidrug transport system permease subunit
MAQKKLQNGSRFNKHDLDGDGIVTDEELAKEKEMVEMELREEKSEAQKRMAWIAMVSMIAFSIFLFLPIVSDNRVKALADLLGLFYIAQAGVVGAYMGATAWMSKK